MKGVLNPDHIPINKYQFLVLGMPTMLFTEISGIEEELQTTDLPDRTVASGGSTGPVEFTAKLPMHHTIEQAAMELWYSQSKDPVHEDYKKPATLIHQSISGKILRTYTIVGAFPYKRVLPDLEMANEGEMASVEWSFKADDTFSI
jgi:hypothetical protein